MNLSNIIKILGTINITTNILIIAPLAINLHKEPIISIVDTIPTPNVAPKKHIPLTTIELTEFSNALLTASNLSLPFFLSSK